MAPILALTFGAGMTLVRLTLGSPVPLASLDLAAPQPALGVWALMTRDCATPTSLDLAAWPACAQPIGFGPTEVSLLQRPEGANSAAKTGKLFSVGSVKYIVVSAPLETGGLLVQVEAPGLTATSYIYLVLRPGVVDEASRFSDAAVFPITCPTTAMEGVTSQGGRCRAATLVGVRTAAATATAPAAYDYTMRLVMAADAPADPGRTIPSVPSPSTPFPR